jgi:hypothetical protein
MRKSVLYICVDSRVCCVEKHSSSFSKPHKSATPGGGIVAYLYELGSIKISANFDQQADELNGSMYGLRHIKAVQSLH